MEILGAFVFLFVLIFLMFAKVPIGFAIGIVSLLAFAIYDLPQQILAQRFYTGMASQTWIAIPLFIFAGTLMGCGGLSRRIVNFSDAVIGHVRGGLGITTIFSCAFFSAISGASPATAAAIGSIMIPEMKNKQYPEKLAAGITASGGVLGVLIPPSIILIAYGVLAEVSIAKLFMGAMIPGALLALTMMFVTYVMARHTVPAEQTFTLTQVFVTLYRGFLSLLAPVIILGGIYLGVFTPTESAVIAVVYGIIVGFVYRELTLRDIAEAIRSTVVTTGTLAIIWAAAASYSYVLTLSGITQNIALAITGVSTEPFIVLTMISVLVVVLGCYINAMGMVILLTPIFVPILNAIGYDLIAFGVIFTMMCEVGYITPPVGTNLFVVKSLCEEADILEISRVVIPYILALYALVLTFVVFPESILYLPNRFL
ncbi:MAG: TRAP transporter large permease [Rhodospirillaceae bacterium]|nr:TRAP transporter large permease [Rhodospirillaceae bacterium]